MTKLIFVLQGYEKENEGGELKDVVMFELYADTYEDAIKKAKKIFKKPNYRVSRVIEVDDKKV